MRIRAVYREDREDVIALWRLAFPEAPAHNDPGRDFDRKMRVQPELFLLAEESERCIGSVMAGYDGHRGWIYYLAVHPEHRRRGLGGLLVRQAEDGLRKLGCPKVNLQVRAENEEVASFYRAMDYHIEERLSFGKRLTGDP